jgi:exosortase/archaeosortase family protein
MKMHTIHLVIGGIWVVGVVLFLILKIQTLWAVQAVIIERLLKFANVPYRLVLLPVVDLSDNIPVYYQPGGYTFSVYVEHYALKPALALLVVLLLGIVGVIIYRIGFVPLPLKVFALFLLVLVISTVLYTSFISPVPPKTVNRLSIDWQYSGAVILLLISIIFFFSIFPIRGPLWIKFLWLFATLLFSLVWNVLRLSVVLATLYHLGSTMFLLTHYLAGIYIDFIYIVAFYSLALAHLARSQVSEVGW